MYKLLLHYAETVMSNSPIQLQVWILAEAKTGIVLKFAVYIGKGTDQDSTMKTYTVHTLDNGLCMLSPGIITTKDITSIWTTSSLPRNFLRHYYIRKLMGVEQLDLH